MHMARHLYPNLKAVYVDTGLEYPEIREFVKTFDNVDWLRPKKNFKQVITEYGYPFISKEVSECVYGARKYLTSIIEQNQNPTDRKTPYKYYYDKLTGQGNYTKFSDALSSADNLSIADFTRGGTITSLGNSEELVNILKQNKGKGSTMRLAFLLGMVDKEYQIHKVENIPSKDRSMFSQTKYYFFLKEDAPIISAHCCRIMKKEPSHNYSKETKRKCMTAEMARESRLRTQKWLQNGCNGFHLKIPKSTPMAFWTEQDVLLYIKENNVPICSVYGDVVSAEFDDLEQIDGQINVSDLGIFDKERPLLKTTGCKRTGCVYCAYGCHLEKDGQGRFERLRITHPQIYDYIMRPIDQGGLNYKEVIDWINENGNLNIKY